MVDYTKKETVVLSSDCSKNKHLSIICYHTYFIWKEFIVSKTKKKEQNQFVLCKQHYFFQLHIEFQMTGH